jgi:hypothetical protein
MIDQRPVTRDMLVGQIDVAIHGTILDFDRAKHIADVEVSKSLTDPVLLAWFDRKEWKHSPAIC